MSVLSRFDIDINSTAIGTNININIEIIGVDSIGTISSIGICVLFLVLAILVLPSDCTIAIGINTILLVVLVSPVLILLTRLLLLSAV